MRHAFGDFVLDVDQRRLFAGDRVLHVQPKAFELLRLLVEARPRAVSKDEILAAVWPGTFVSENNLATVVRDLRAALGDDAQEPRFIRTVYGFGYAFAGEVATPAAPPPESGWRLIHEHREIRLRDGDNVLGRSGDGVIVVDSPTVSRHHARVRVDDEHATVEDLGSKNGTWIETRPVGVTPVPLVSGGQLRLGSVQMTVQFTRQTPTTESVRSTGPGAR